MPKFLRWSIIAILLFPLLSACGKPGEQGGAPNAGQMPPPPVTVAQPIVKNIIEWDDFTGRFEAVDKVNVRARVGGYLQATHFKEGDLVNKGDLLFTIDQRPYQAALRQANAAVANAQARVEFTTNEVERAKNLRARGNVPERILEQRIQEQRQAEADLASAKGALDQAKLDMEFTQVRAPIAGRISSNFVTEGNLITGGTADSTLLTTIVSLSPIHFVFDIDEQAYIKYSRLSRIGDRPSSRDNANPVFVAVADEKEFRHRGMMNFVDNIINDGTGTMRGRAIFDNTDKFLTPGQFGRIRVLGSGQYQAVLIPDAAIMTDQSRKLALTVDENNIVKAVPVTLGPLVDGLRVVRQGLSGSERIIINGLQRAQDGAPVTIEPGQIEAGASDIQPELLALINAAAPSVPSGDLTPDDQAYKTQNTALGEPVAPPRDNAAPTVTLPPADGVAPPPAPEVPAAKPKAKKPLTGKPQPADIETTASPPPAPDAAEPTPAPVVPPVSESIPAIPENPAPPVDSSSGNKALVIAPPAAAEPASITPPVSPPSMFVPPVQDAFIQGGQAAPIDQPPPPAPVVLPPTLAPDVDDATGPAR